jgi:hypothetical protein
MAAAATGSNQVCISDVALELASSVYRRCELRNGILPTRRSVFIYSQESFVAIISLVSYEVFKNASEADLVPMRIHEGTIGLTEIHFPSSSVFSDI